MMEGSIFQKSLVKGKLMKKLKSIKQVGYLKPDRILQVSAADGFVESFQKISNFVTQSPQKIVKKIEQGSLSLKSEKQSTSGLQEAEVIDVAELMRDLEDEENGDGVEFEDKENVKPSVRTDDKDFILVDRRKEVDEKPPLSEIDISSFRRPDMNSGSLFDPKLLAAFEEAARVQIFISIKAEEKLISEAQSFNPDSEPPLKLRKTDQGSAQAPMEKEDRDDDVVSEDPLEEFELKCPPGGSDSIILYTTSLRGIRKTFEDCQSIRFLLETFKVQFFERDVSMHSEYRAEMWQVTEQGKALPPRLFVKGRYIGGAEEVLRLHEQGKFRRLLEGVRLDERNGMCEGCGGMRFVVCFKCSGSHRVDDDDGGGWDKCVSCNENGLIVCPYCC
uniref:Glutaredoxin domain-containing protein n=1 Tax=Kalanchoe fedtschenkoi TaxID=63787 RepID=A0A7N0TMZ2_KALFE